MWNTGCRMITNNLDFPLLVLDQEDQKYEITVPGHAMRDFHGVIFPWCDNLDEVKTKAFAFFRLDTGLSFFMFQFFQDDQVYWLPAEDPLPPFEEKQHAGAPPSSNVDVVVNWMGFAKPEAFQRA